MERDTDTGHFFPPLPPPPTLPSFLSTSVQVNNSDDAGTSSSTNDLHPSILIIALILTLVFLLSASIHLLLRCLDRRRLDRLSTLSSSSSSSDDDSRSDSSRLPPTHSNPLFSRRVSPEEQPPKTVVDSLPIFTFSAVFPGGGGEAQHKDCAVCLAHFEAHDELRLLPACSHAFHAACIDAWLATSLTCPLCRSSIRLPDDSLPSSRSASFRLEIGSVSRRINPEPAEPGALAGSRRRSYSVGSFDYVLNDEPEVVVVPPVLAPVPSSRSLGQQSSKESVQDGGPAPPGPEMAEAAGGRGWLKEYMDRLASSASSSMSSRTVSFRFSGRFGGSRRSGSSWDLEGNPAGDENNYSNIFRWLAGL